jgi:hypothetical protein
MSALALTQAYDGAKALCACAIITAMLALHAKSNGFMYQNKNIQ